MWASSSCVSGPLGRVLQADAVWELVDVHYVVLQGAFPELLPAGPTARLRVPFWWPTQTNRQGDGGALGPQVVERGGIQIERRGRSLADEAVRGKHFTEEKHLLRVKWLKTF